MEARILCMCYTVWGAGKEGNDSVAEQLLAPDVAHSGENVVQLSDNSFPSAAASFKYRLVQGTRPSPHPPPPPQAPIRVPTGNLAQMLLRRFGGILAKKIKAGL